MSPPHDEFRAVILATEQRLRDSFENNAARELELVDDASSLLALVMTRVGPRTATVQLDRAGVPSGDTATVNLAALTLLGARALRVVRAARATLASGYEAEARAHDRILVELKAHRRGILNDTSGKAALDWVKGKRGRGISARVAAMAPKDLYKSLSQDSHGGPEPVARLMDAATQTVNLEPRRTAATRASLLMHAGFCRDQAAVIAEAAGLRLAGLEELDAAIRAAWERLDAEADAKNSEKP